jgi:Ca2+-transporting ATPase
MAVERAATPPDSAGASAEDSAPWALSREEVAERFETEPVRGLSDEEVRRRRRRFGPNRVREAKRESAWRILARQFASLIMLLLVVAAAVAAVFGQVRDGTAIAAVIVVNAAIGFAVELRAVRSMEALRQLGRVETRVRRGGTIRAVAAADLVPGDVVVLEAGDLVPADLRLAGASKLQADESPLTGESTPVTKNVEPVDRDTPLAERHSMLFRGTAVTRGSAEGVVTATGMDTEMGRIARMVEEAEAEETPLERRLDRLGAQLVWVTLAVAAFVTASGILAGKDLLLMVETGIALAVATVPEGLPVVATVALARGMWRMARRNALVNRLSAVETLGATTVVCSDKTGTLTENRMSVTRLALDGETLRLSGPEGRGRPFSRDGEPVDPASDAALRMALETAVLCNNAELPADAAREASGEPMEVALLRAGREAGIERPRLLERMPEMREEAFLPDTKMMATFHRQNGRFRVAVKGAPEAVLDVCSRVLGRDGETELSDDARRQWLERNEQMAEEGARVLALATKTANAAEAPPYEDLALLGLVGLMDPPRADVREAIEGCRRAGVRVVMVTGDQAGTATAVGKSLGLGTGAGTVHGGDLAPPEKMSEPERRRVLEAAIFARVSPKQKLDLIAIHQSDGAVVAMTGDGVNDAPALKKADIGIAMGKRGTQVAAQAADMVLRDDAFSTIVTAVEQGRIIFDNIRKFVFYLLSCNVSEVLVVAMASLVRLPLPIQPLQILFLNLVTDVFPALALGAGEGEPGIMRRPPRDPRAPILTRGHWLAIGAYGLLMTGSVLGALALALKGLGVEKRAAVTLSFLTLAFAQLWHVFNMSDPRAGLLRSDVLRNLWVWGALVLCTALLLVAIYAPVLARALDLVAPDAPGWALVAALSAAPLCIGRVVALARRRTGDGSVQGGAGHSNHRSGS